MFGACVGNAGGGGRQIWPCVCTSSLFLFSQATATAEQFPISRLVVEGIAPQCNDEQAATVLFLVGIKVLTSEEMC